MGQIVSQLDHTTEFAMLIITPNTGQEVCTQLLEDDPQRAQQRILLKKQKARLEEAKRRLDQLELQFGTGNSSFTFTSSVQELS
jgi:hypothetical protein